MDLTLGYTIYYRMDGTLSPKSSLCILDYIHTYMIHSALLTFGFGFGRNKALHSASVSFSAETTLLFSAPVSVSAEFIKISSGRSLVLIALIFE